MTKILLTSRRAVPRLSLGVHRLLTAPIVIVSMREERWYRRLPESLRDIVPGGMIVDIRPLGAVTPTPPTPPTPPISETPPAA